MRWILLSEYLTLLALILLVSELPASIITNTVISYQETPISFRGILFLTLSSPNSSANLELFLYEELTPR